MQQISVNHFFASSVILKSCRIMLLIYIYICVKYIYWVLSCELLFECCLFCYLFVYRVLTDMAQLCVLTVALFSVCARRLLSGESRVFSILYNVYSLYFLHQSSFYVKRIIFLHISF